MRHALTFAAGLSVGELYEAHQTSVWCYLERRLRSADRAVVDDLAQEVWVRVWRSIDRYEDRGVPILAWLYRIAHNLLVDWLRDRREATSIDALMEQHREPSVTYRWDEVCARDALGGALARLTPEQRRVVTLRFLLGYSTLQTTTVMERSEDAVKKLQARALAAMHRYLTRVEEQAA